MNSNQTGFRNFFLQNFESRRHTELMNCTFGYQLWSSSHEMHKLCMLQDAAAILSVRIWFGGSLEIVLCMLDSPLILILNVLIAKFSSL